MSKLFIVPTPIGNLEDMTLRAIRIIGDADLLLAEDTRTTSKLLQHYGIKVPMMAHHLHNEHKVLQSLIAKLKSGLTIALVTDAGTPAISDPGFLLVRECIRHGIDVECLPGATAFAPALVNSGLPAERFCFEGFLPQKKGRSARLNSLVNETRTMVFYESPHRLQKTLAAFAQVFGPERQASVARELSKLHEENARGTLHELIAHFEKGTIKGEICIVVAGAATKGKTESPDED